MSSPHSSSDRSRAFEQLHPEIQRWIWDQGWEELRDAQERSIPVIRARRNDVIIAATTAAGKTEAAFLPILTNLRESSPAGLALYIGPLKALINDQWGRLELLCERLGLPVTPWHGDISASKKRTFFRKRNGCLLITPESLEGMLIRHGTQLAGVYDGLQHIVIDELHAFFGTERGRQLQSLLHRIEIAIGRQVPRIGLSATLGDMNGAREFLRPGRGSEVELIESKDSGRELKVIIKGYMSAASFAEVTEQADQANAAQTEIGKELFRTLRGSHNLVFPNSRRSVEIYADLLRRECEALGVPNEFWPHHGSLSRAVREDAEKALKDRSRPSTAIATTTLELGIDIGSVTSVAQIGTAPGVASLRQRLGRSGRKANQPQILRGYCIESPLDADSELSDRLREGLVQLTAQINLLIRGWYEPPEAGTLHLSTLVQQLLSLIAQYGGITATQAWTVLCASGVFPGLSQAEFADFLRAMAEKSMLMQDSSGVLLHGSHGERCVNSYDFLAAFMAREEYQVIAAGRPLGSLPIDRPLQKGSFIILAGRRWEVIDCRMSERVVQVKPSVAGRAPTFNGMAGRTHDIVRSEMRTVLATGQAPMFLDARASALLGEAQVAYRENGLNDRRIVPWGGKLALLTWAGDKVNDTITAWLTNRGFRASNDGLVVSVTCDSIDSLLDALFDLGDGPAPSLNELISDELIPFQEKWEHLLPVALLRRQYGSRVLDIERARVIAREIAAS